MNFDETCRRIAEFTNERDWNQFHTPENLAKSIAIESAELLECFQWKSDANDKHVREELADVMNYCILLAQRNGYDICEILNDKLDKNEKNIQSKSVKV